jgi:hypothetical protein
MVGIECPKALLEKENAACAPRFSRPIFFVQSAGYGLGAIPRLPIRGTESLTLMAVDAGAGLT